MCQWCLSNEHSSDQCPYVRRLELYPSGFPRLVEFRDRAAEQSTAMPETLIDPERTMRELILAEPVTDLPQSVSLGDLAARAKGEPL